MNDDNKIKNNLFSRARSVIDEFQDKATDISWGIFSLGFFVSLLSIGYEIFSWLKNGEWPNLRFLTMFSWLNLDSIALVNGIGWQGIKKILIWCLDLPLSVGLVGLGGVLGGTFYVFFSRKD